MRIRNRPAPSIFPPPPDLNLNRSFPKPQQAVQVQEPSHDVDTTAADHHNHAPYLHRNTHPRSASSIAFELSSDQLPLATYSTLRRSGKVCAKRSSGSSAASSDSDDNDITRDGNDVEDTGVRPLSRTKVDNGWEGEKAGQIIQTAAAKDNSKKAKGVTEKEPSAGILNKGAKIKRVSRVGAAIMEGSRCSRVNGRGWRCGQQTLVGYSLCEHHLGKSRLRSLTSMKNNNITASSIDHVAVALGSSKKERPGEESDDDDEPLVESRRKKSKIGTVKARSLRSLLGQTSQTNGMSSQVSMSKANNADN